jgi:hypothetical protein
MLKKFTLFFHCLRQAVALSTSDLDKFLFAINSFNSSIGRSTTSLWVKGNPIGTSFSSFRRPLLKVFKLAGLLPGSSKIGPSPRPKLKLQPLP